MELTGRQIRISVRNLVEFVLRSGDIDNRRTAGAQKEAMLAGGRMHRKIQRRMGPGYQAEVTLRHSVEEDGFQIVVEGRADGIIRDGTEVTIDEIKCVYQDVNRLEEAVGVHMAQARCYGYIYGLQEELDEVTLQITYCNLETEEIRRFQEIQTMDELSEWFAGLIHEYVKWARYLYHNGLRRDESIKALEFPYPYRPGQRDLAVAVYRTLARGRRLFVQAPTGIGKTLSTVFPALKAIGEGHGQKLFYLTAKTITRTVAEEALAILRERGLYFRSVTITAKEKLCILEKPACNPEMCPRAKGHFDRVNDAVYEILHQEFGITRSVILEYAEKFQVCPFEFCLDISSFVDGIICDYNYVFDPDVRLKRYFADGAEGDYFFLMDEAHNLVSRAREMYSASIIKEEVLLTKKVLGHRAPALGRQLTRLNKALLEMKRECDGYQVLADAGHLVSVLNGVFGEMEKYLEKPGEEEGRDTILDFYFSVRHFLNMYERVDEHYRIYTELLPFGEFVIRLYCVNPIENLAQCLSQGKAAVFFSATLLPLRYYRMLLSDEEEDYTVYVPSPFPQERRLLLAATDVTSRYTRRNETEYRRVVRYIQAMAEARKGNYIVIFPSYQYMNRVLEVYEGEYACQNAELDEENPFWNDDGKKILISDVVESFEKNQNEKMENRSGGTRKCMEILVQDSHMTEEEREAFLQEFSPERTAMRDTSLVAFCVMGGLFSEGIDLTGDRLIGVIVVGTGLPMVCTEQKILQGYFEEAGKDGFAYAYQYPGMNKVLQAAGRVIRTASDQGVILLLDDRFWRREYRELFPREWNDVKRVSLASLEQELQTFWSRFPEVR